MSLCHHLLITAVIRTLHHPCHHHPPHSQFTGGSSHEVVSFPHHPLITAVISRLITTPASPMSSPPSAPPVHRRVLISTVVKALSFSHHRSHHHPHRHPSSPISSPFLHPQLKQYSLYQRSCKYFPFLITDLITTLRTTPASPIS